MALKTFNLNAEVYEEFSKYCKKEGISMSRKIENFLKEEVGKIKVKEVKKVDAVKPKEGEVKMGEHSFSKYC